MTTVRPDADDLLLGEWACLGILDASPSHGFAIAARLAPSGDVGRVWSMSRALTYRSLDQLAARSLVRRVREERGIAGGNRTVLAVTPLGRRRVRTWYGEPVRHLRDLRTELLLKLVLAEPCGVDMTPMLQHQRAVVAGLAAALAVNDTDHPDVVATWRAESSAAALRFVDRVLAQRR